MPARPKAGAPSARSSLTICLFTSPANTAMTTSIAAGPVTRSPSTNSLSMPWSFSQPVAASPPPWTTTTARPEARSAATSASAVSWLPRVLPPTFATIGPFIGLIVGQRAVN